MNTKEIDKALLSAHDRNDVPSLVRLYSFAADEREKNGDIDGACFYLTHAYVFALQSDAPEVPALNKRLFEQGREERYGW